MVSIPKSKMLDCRLSPYKTASAYLGRRPRTESHKKVAEMGHHLMATLGPDPAPLYIETLKENGKDPSDFKVAQLRMVYCAETEDQAWEECQDHLFHMLDFIAILSRKLRR
jgi:alkanesulfonate monooxygenase SsuD/methylene tetrahydromethanopterin reductase-like flavin-dependent oxidoreductase (luciferase family)